MSMPGPMEWVIILLIIVVLFGAKRLPGLGSAIGESLKNFKRSMAGLGDVSPEKKIETSDDSKKSDQ